VRHGQTNNEQDETATTDGSGPRRARDPRRRTSNRAFLEDISLPVLEDKPRGPTVGTKPYCWETGQNIDVGIPNIDGYRDVDIPALIDLYAAGDCLICARSDGLLSVLSMDLELLQVIAVQPFLSTGLSRNRHDGGYLAYAVNEIKLNGNEVMVCDDWGLICSYQIAPAM
jgi:hypothetical protein